MYKSISITSKSISFHIIHIETTFFLFPNNIKAICFLLIIVINGRFFSIHTFYKKEGS